MKKRMNEKQKLLDSNLASGVGVWAHRGCSYQYPENTIQAFEAACQLPGITGIELDVRLSKDKELVVFHDDTVDRLTMAKGRVESYTAEELKHMTFQSSDQARIPTMREVLEFMKPYMKSSGIFLNIELKNHGDVSAGLEEKIVSLVREFGLGQSVIYSSFYGKSLEKIKSCDSSAGVAILGISWEECRRYKEIYGVDDCHPNLDSLLEREQEIDDSDTSMAVRVWSTREPFYNKKTSVPVFDLKRLKSLGVTDIITNVPERYLSKMDKLVRKEA